MKKNHSEVIIFEVYAGDVLGHSEIKPFVYVIVKLGGYSDWWLGLLPTYSVVAFASSMFALFAGDWKLTNDVLTAFDKGLRGNNLTIGMWL